MTRGMYGDGVNVNLTA